MILFLSGQNHGMSLGVVRSDHGLGRGIGTESIVSGNNGTNTFLGISSRTPTRKSPSATPILRTTYTKNMPKNVVLITGGAGWLGGVVSDFTKSCPTLPDEMCSGPDSRRSSRDCCWKTPRHLMCTSSYAISSSRNIPRAPRTSSPPKLI